MKPGRYKSVRSMRPIERAHGRVALATEGTEVFKTIDLTLEGQAAYILAVKFEWLIVGALADANDDIYDIKGLLTMDEDFNPADLDSNFSAYMDSEQVITNFSHNFQNVITTSGQTVLPGKSEMQIMPAEGILVPESVRLAGVIADGGSTASVLECSIWYKRIENPTAEMKDYFYRRR